MGFLETLQRFEVHQLKTSEWFSRSDPAKWERERACAKEGALDEDSRKSVLVLALPKRVSVGLYLTPQASGVLTPKRKE